MKTCSINGCDRKHHGKGYCKFHNKRFRKHGDPLFRLTENHNKTGTPIYITWTNMKRRCSNKKGWDYKYYGGRGITVCDRWLHSFNNFYEDMGDIPFEGAELDRRENDKGYSKDNCRWITHAKNTQNNSHTKITMEIAREIRRKYIIEKLSIMELSEIYKLHRSTISRIIKNKTWREK